MVSRRDFLASGAVAALSARALAAEAEAAKKIPIGLQLYTLRNEAAKDLPGTIAEVAKAGYKGIEFAGYHNRKAEELRKMLDDNGLRCCGTHTGMGTILGDNLKKTVEFNKTLGNRYLIVPGGVGGKSKESWVEAAKRFNDIAEKLKPEGMVTGYHNHAHEFKKFGPDDPETPWEALFGAASQDVVMQLDIGNGMGGGCDPVATLKKFPGRAITVHVKGYQGIVGEDKAPWPEIFALCETTGKTEWYIVEQDGSNKLSPLDTIKRVMDNLKKMGKV
ncbi:MAG: sugar phosphate isomerase/epimerase [Planctomycetes bacterium]|nr:sugar phosphate isomerase/epimerase [Planctomycetota bacterium]